MIEHPKKLRKIYMNREAACEFGIDESRISAN